MGLFFDDQEKLTSFGAKTVFVFIVLAILLTTGYQLSKIYINQPRLNESTWLQIDDQALGNTFIVATSPKLNIARDPVDFCPWSNLSNSDVNCYYCRVTLNEHQGWLQNERLRWCIQSIDWNKTNSILSRYDINFYE